MKLLKFPLLIVLIGLTISCSDDWKDRYNTRTAEDSSLAEALFADVYAQVLNPNTLNNQTYKMGSENSSGSCPIVTIAPFDGSFPVTVTVDFGSSNCLGVDGRNRRGVLMAVLDGQYRDPGTTIVITPHDYYVNDNKVEGTQTVKNLGHNTQGHLQFSVEEKNGRVHTPKGTIHWESQRMREWVAGESTITPWDDVYLISGSATGKDTEGRNYTLNIVKPLRVQVGCRWVTEGILDVLPEGLETRTIDYGNGDCNGTAEVTVGSYNFTVVVP